MSEEMRGLDDAAFAERIAARIEEEGRLADEATLKAALQVAQEASGARGRELRRPSPWWAGRAGWAWGLLWAAAGALVATGVAVALSAGPGEAPAAFDGGVGVAPGGGRASEVRRDGEGRLVEVLTRGAAGEERLLFRSGRLVRVEQLRGGKVHGMAVDFDGSGRVVAVRTWVDGVERGPWFEVSPGGVVERSGVVE